MTWILRILIFICAVFLVRSSLTIYEAKENDNITIKWDSQIKTDMTHTDMTLLLLSDPPKVFYEMFRGNEDLERQHQQFAGRVQCDKDALRDGRIRLRFFRVTSGDSGNYSFDLAANYDRTLRKPVLYMFELFVLNISQASDGEDTHPSAYTPGQENNEDDKDQPGGPETRGTWRNWIIGLSLAFFFFSFCVLCCVS